LNLSELKQKNRFGLLVGVEGALSVANHTGFLLVRGAVFTATMTDVSDKQRPTVLDAPLGKIKVPCLIVHHKEDGCGTTPSEDVV